MASPSTLGLVARIASRTATSAPPAPRSGGRARPRAGRRGRCRRGARGRRAGRGSGRGSRRLRSMASTSWGWATTQTSPPSRRASRQIAQGSASVRSQQTRAEPDLLADLGDRGGEGGGVLGGGAQDVEREAGGGLLADAGELGELLHEPRDGRGDHALAAEQARGQRQPARDPRELGLGQLRARSSARLTAPTARSSIIFLSPSDRRVDRRGRGSRPCRWRCSGRARRPVSPTTVLLRELLAHARDLALDALGGREQTLEVGHGHQVLISLSEAPNRSWARRITGCCAGLLLAASCGRRRRRRFSAPTADRTAAPGGARRENATRVGPPELLGDRGLDLGAGLARPARRSNLSRERQRDGAGRERHDLGMREQRPEPRPLDLEARRGRGARARRASSGAQLGRRRRRAGWRGGAAGPASAARGPAAARRGRHGAAGGCGRRRPRPPVAGDGFAGAARSRGGRPAALAQRRRRWRPRGAARRAAARRGLPPDRRRASSSSSRSQQIAERHQRLGGAQVDDRHLVEQPRRAGARAPRRRARPAIEQHRRPARAPRAPPARAPPRAPRGWRRPGREWRLPAASTRATTSRSRRKPEERAPELRRDRPRGRRRRAEQRAAPRAASRSSTAPASSTSSRRSATPSTSATISRGQALASPT